MDMYFPIHHEFYIVRYEYFCVPLWMYFSVFIFLFVTKTIASLYKVLALMHIFTASIIPPIISIRIALQSTHLLKILWSVLLIWEACRTPWKGVRCFADSKKKTLQSFFVKKSIVQTKKRTVGPQNGASQLFLTAFQVQVSEHILFLTIILNSKFLNNFPIQKEDIFVIADVKIEGKILTLANIYAPNDDNPTFFKNVLNQLIYLLRVRWDSSRRGL